MTSLIIRSPYNPFFQTSVPLKNRLAVPTYLSHFLFFFFPLYPHFLMAGGKMRYAGSNDSKRLQEIHSEISLNVSER